MHYDNGTRPSRDVRTVYDAWIEDSVWCIMMMEDHCKMSKLRTLDGFFDCYGISLDCGWRQGGPEPSECWPAFARQ